MCMHKQIMLNVNMSGLNWPNGKSNGGGPALNNKSKMCPFALLYVEFYCFFLCVLTLVEIAANFVSKKNAF